MNTRIRKPIAGIFLCVVGLIITLAGCSDSTPTAGVTALDATSRPPISPGVTTQPPPSTLSELTDIPLPSASPSRMPPPVSAQTGESICFATTQPPEPFSRFPEEKQIAQCMPIEENRVDLDRVVTLGDVPGDTIIALEASPNGQWLAVTFVMGEPVATQVFEMMAGQEVKIEPNGSWYSSFHGWGSDGNTAILSKQEDAIFFDMTNQHAEVESVSSYPFGVALAPDGQRVAYAQSGQGFGAGELYIKKRGIDEPLASLTDIEATFLNLSWSPAGNVIAYLRIRDLNGRNGELWVTDETLQSPHKLSDLATGHYMLVEYTPRWSPDGRWLAFVVWDDPPQVADDPPDKRTGNIYIADSLSGQVQALTSFKGVWTDWPSWSPDGRWIIFSKVENDTSDLWMVEVATGRLQQLTSGLNARHPAWVAHSAPVLPTPTPTSTATPLPIPSVTPTYKYSPTPSPTAVLGPLTVLQTTTSEGLPVEFYHLPKAYFTGVAVGSQVVFSDLRNRLILVDLANPGAGGVMIGNADTSSIKAAPAAHALVYSPYDPDAYKYNRFPLVALHLDDGRETPLGYTDGEIYPIFGLSSNGKVLMLEDHHLVIKNLEGTESQPLTQVEAALGEEWGELDLDLWDYENYGLSSTDVSLSPDGQRIAVAYNGLLRLLTVDGSPILGMAFPDASVWLIEWSPNGEYLFYGWCVYYSCQFGPSPRILDIATGTEFMPRLPKPDPDEEVYYVAWSMTGDRMAFVTGRSIYIADRHGDNVRRLVEADRAVGRLAWTTEQRILYGCSYQGLDGVCRITPP